MVEYEDECVGCPKEIGCLSFCPNKNVEHHYCDDCGDEDTLYEYEGEELCIDCVKRRLNVVWRCNLNR